MAHNEAVQQGLGFRVQGLGITLGPFEVAIQGLSSRGICGGTKKISNTITLVYFPQKSLEFRAWVAGFHGCTDCCGVRA